MKMLILFSLLIIGAHNCMSAQFQFQICARNRKRFETEAKKLAPQDKENRKILSNLYKKIDPSVADKFVEKEVDNYLNPCGCCYQGPSKPCVIL